MSALFPALTVVQMCNDADFSGCEHLLRLAQIHQIEDVLNDIQNSRYDQDDAGDGLAGFAAGAGDQGNDLRDDHQEIDADDDLVDVVALLLHLGVAQLAGEVDDRLDDIDGNHDADDIGNDREDVGDRGVINKRSDNTLDNRDDQAGDDQIERHLEGRLFDRALLGALDAEDEREDSQNRHGQTKDRYAADTGCCCAFGCDFTVGDSLRQEVGKYNRHDRAKCTDQGQDFGDKDFLYARE